MATESHDPQPQEAPVAYKLVLTYHVNDELMQDYYRFMLGRYVPMIQGLGLEMTDAWHTAYGDQPNRLVAFVSRERATIDKVLTSAAWESLTEELARYVTGFRFKLIPYREGFQL